MIDQVIIYFKDFYMKMRIISLYCIPTAYMKLFIIIMVNIDWDLVYRFPR